MKIHGVISAYLGNDEFDVDKTTRWNTQFVDTAFAMDLSQGPDVREILIDWAREYPDVKSAYYQHTPTYFAPGGAAEWRKTSFAKGDLSWSYDDNDWVVFVDCTEALSINEAIDLLPDPPSEPPEPWPAPPPVMDPVLLNPPNLFWPWLEQEINGATGTQISLPVYAFVGNSPTWWITEVVDTTLQTTIDAMSDTEVRDGFTKAEWNVINRSASEKSYQSWTLAGYSPRMFKVSALRNSSFDWASLDVYNAAKPTDAAKFGSALMTYGYARWTHNRRRIDRTSHRPMAVGDDDGFRIRQLMSKVRPVAGLPYDFWNSTDTVGRTAAHNSPPASVIPVQRAYSSDFNHNFSNFTAVVPTQPGAAWGAWDVLQTGVYPEIIRTNVPEWMLADPLLQEPWNYYTGQPQLTEEERKVWYNPVPVLQAPPTTVIPFPDIAPWEQQQGAPAPGSAR